MPPTYDPAELSPQLPPTPEALIGNASHFPVLDHWMFYNHGGVCPLPAVAANALRDYAQQASTSSYLGAHWYARCDWLRAAAARLINAQADEIALLKNTGEGLSLVAEGIAWQPDDRVVTAQCEYPSNQYPWMSLARLGVELVRVPELILPDGSAVVREEDLMAACDHPRTKLLSISHVQFASGCRVDLAKLGAFCRQRNILFCVDAIQSWGALPLDVRAMHIDFAAADGHKWLLGPDGAAFFYCRKDLLDSLRPSQLGARSVVHDTDYSRIDLNLKPSAERYECGSLSMPGFMALAASVRLIEFATVPLITARLKHLTAELAARAANAGFTVVSPTPQSAPDRWSGAVCLTHPRLPQEQDLIRLATQLKKQHRIEAVVRGQRLRFTPHFYTPDRHIDQTAAALESVF